MAEQIPGTTEKQVQMYGMQQYCLQLKLEEKEKGAATFFDKDLTQKKK